MDISAAPPRKPASVYGVFLILSLVFLPPIGLALLAIQNPWTKRAGNTLAVFSVVWLAALIIGLFNLPDMPAVAPVMEAAELAEFKGAVDKAIEIRSAITDLEEHLIKETRASRSLSVTEFHDESLPLQNQIDTLQIQFVHRFGGEIGEYRMQHGGRNDKLFFRTSEVVSRLRSVWLAWHLSVMRGGDKSDLRIHDHYFWEAVNDARSLLSNKPGLADMTR